MDELLTTDQAAALLQLEAATLSNWRTKRVGPVFVRLGARAIRYRRADVLAFIRRGAVAI